MDAGTVMTNINWLAVVVAAVSTFVLGGLWYGPLVGKAWMRATGMTEEELGGAMGRIFAGAFLLQFLTAFALAMFIGSDAGLSFGVFAATALGVVYLFERRSFALWAIDATYQILAFTLMGAILGAW